MNCGRQYILVLVLTSIVLVHPVHSQPSDDIIMRHHFEVGKDLTRYFHIGASYNHLSRQLVTKRQTSDEATVDGKNCTLQQSLNLLCSTGYHQTLIDAYLNCGGIEYAIKVAESCAQNERGELCLAVYHKLRYFDFDLDYVDGNCSQAVTSGSCLPNCRTLSTDLAAGACIGRIR